jgi:hypothetical protein
VAGLIFSVSAAMMPSACTSRSSSTRSSRVEGSPDSIEPMRSSHERRFSGISPAWPLLLSSSGIAFRWLPEGVRASTAV